MTNFKEQDLTGARFEKVRLRGAHLEIADLRAERDLDVLEDRSR